MINPETIEEIKEKSDIVKIISEYVPLKKRGQNYLGLCPFHNEKTASFTVSPEKKIFHCFGCNEGGNIFSFIMKAENVDFVEAIEILANKLNIFIKRSGTKGKPTGFKNNLIDIMVLAVQFYQDNLNKNVPAQQYLEKRGISEQTTQNFRLGAAPNNWDELFKFLLQKGVSPQDIEKAGLILAREKREGFYDRFRNRIMFPIFNLQNKPIAFGGRALNPEEVKYINSPDSPIYNKGDFLYTLNSAKDHIKKEGFAILVEGYMDLIACHQIKAFNTVAALGTALTSNQAKLLKRFAENVVLAFDSDTAGNAATFRSVEILRNAGLSVKVAKLTDCKDPDEFIKKNGARAFAECILSAKNYLEYKFDQVLLRYNISEIEAKANAIREVAGVLSRETDKLVQSEYAKLAAVKLNTDTDTLLREMGRLSFYKTEKGLSHKNLRRVTDKPASGVILAEQALIKAGIEDTLLLDQIREDISSKDFSVAEHAQIAEILLNTNFESPEKITDFLLENLPGEDVKKTLSKIALEQIPNLGKEAVKDYINKIKSAGLKVELQKIKDKLSQAERSGNNNEIPHLHEEFNNCNKALMDLIETSGHS